MPLRLKSISLWVLGPMQVPQKSLAAATWLYSLKSPNPAKTDRLSYRKGGKTCAVYCAVYWTVFLLAKLYCNPVVFFLSLLKTSSHIHAPELNVFDFSIKMTTVDLFVVLKFTCNTPGHSYG